MEEECEHLTMLPYFDLNEAIENYGFDFDSFKENNFQDFIVKLTEEYETMRKSYIIKDLIKVRAITHKLKGLFL